MNETYTRSGKISYTVSGVAGVEIEFDGIPMNVAIENGGSKTTVNFDLKYESDALTVFDAIIAAAVEAKRAIENRHQTQATNQSEWAETVKKIYKRCQMCRSTETIEAHHLEAKNYSPSLMLSLGNGTVLCKQCHSNFHSKYGTKTSRKDFNEWLQKGNSIKTFICKPDIKSSSKSVSEQNGELPSRRKPAKWTAYEIAIQYFEQHQSFPSYRQLADMAKCMRERYCWKSCKTSERTKRERSHVNYAGNQGNLYQLGTAFRYHPRYYHPVPRPGTIIRTTIPVSPIRYHHPGTIDPVPLIPSIRYHLPVPPPGTTIPVP